MSSNSFFYVLNTVYNKKVKIVLLGSGNVATHLGRALLLTDNDVVQVYSRTKANAQALADVLGCDATDDVDDVRADADMYIFSVKDDALPSLVQKIAPRNASALYLHTAGSVNIDIFKGYARRYGVLYPMQTFSKSREFSFRQVPCFVEASDDTVLAAVEALAQSVTDNVTILPSAKRKSLHLAAVFACNFTNHCYRMAERVLADAGIDFSAMLPLIDMTAQKVHEMSPRDAQTGPAIRYDENVINCHLDMLDDDIMREVYAFMSRSIHQSCEL